MNMETLPTPDQIKQDAEDIVRKAAAANAEDKKAKVDNPDKGDGKGKKAVELRDHDREAEIKKLAYYIWEHRMSNDPKRQEKAAKEYGLDEKAFLEETIKNIKVSKGKKLDDIQWTDEAQKIMQDWDYKMAEKIYEAKKNEWFKKEGGEEPEVGPKVAKSPEDTEAGKGPEGAEATPKGPEGAEAAPAGEAAAEAEGGPKDKADKPEESDFEKKKKELEKGMNEAAEKYARLYSETKSKQGLIRRTLGFENVEKDPAVEKAREAYVALRQKYNKEMLDYIESQHKDGKLTDEQALDLTNRHITDAYINHDAVLSEKKMQYRLVADKDPKRSWFSSRVETTFNKFIDKYRKLPWWAKTGASLILAGSGIGLAAMGAVGAAGVVSVGMVGMRAIGGAAAGKGMQEFLQAQADKFRQRRGQVGTERMRDVANLEGMSMEEKFIYAKKLMKHGDQDMDKRFKRMERGDHIRRYAGLFTAAFVALGVSGRIIRETGLGGWLKEKVLGSLPGTGGVAKPGMEVPEKVPFGTSGHLETPAKGMTFGLYNPDGSLTPEGDAYFKQYNIEPLDDSRRLTFPKGASGTSELPVGNPVESPDQAYGSELTGTEQMGHGEFSGDTMQVKQDSNIWATTREIFMKHADQYGYDEDQARKSFGNLREQGYLRRMGIRGAGNFEDLTTDQKHKIWAEWKTATELDNYAKHGGKIPRVVHEGYSVMVDNKGHIILGSEAPDIRAGKIPDNVPGARGGGAAAADTYTQTEAPAAHETAGKRPDFLKEFDERQRAAKANFAEKAAAAARTHEALVQSRGDLAAASAAEAAQLDNVGMHEWMDRIQEGIYGKGTTVDWKEPAAQFRQRMFGKLLTSDQPMGPSSNLGEQQQYWRTAQAVNRGLGPVIGNENVESWLQRGLASRRVRPDDVIDVLRRVANA